MIYKNYDLTLPSSNILYIYIYIYIYLFIYPRVLSETLRGKTQSTLDCCLQYNDVFLSFTMLVKEMQIRVRNTFSQGSINIIKLNRGKLVFFIIKLLIYLLNKKNMQIFCTFFFHNIIT